MSYVTVVWSRVASAGLTLAATHLLVVHCSPLASQLLKRERTQTVQTN